MLIQKWTITAALVVTAMMGFVSTAEAQFGGIPQYLFRAAEYAGNQSFLSNPQGGPLYNFNSFNQRIERNLAGGGYTWESYRFFGEDSYGNPNTLDLGPLKVQLGQGPSIGSGQPIGVHNRIGYTTTILPEVFFECQTGQRTYNQFSGVSNFSPTPVRYNITLNTGIQDFTWEGDGLINTSGRINAMGFYDFELRFVNVGSYQADGMFLQDEQVTDFDVGPINASGNIGLDMLSGFLQNIGNPNGALVPRIISGGAQKDKRVDGLLARLRAGETLSDAEMQFLAQEMFKAAFAADPFGVTQDGLPSEVPGFEGLTLNMLTTSKNEGDSEFEMDNVPEPGTLAFLGLALIISSAAGSIRRQWAW